jgi:hypothetical protein
MGDSFYLIGLSVGVWRLGGVQPFVSWLTSFSFRRLAYISQFMDDFCFLTWSRNFRHRIPTLEP